MTDNEAAHAAMEGVWTTPQGTRVEIVREGTVWRAYPYLFRKGGSPAAIVEYDTADEVAAVIAALESKGHRREPDRAPDGARTVGEAVAAGAAAQWSSPAHVAGAALLLLVLVLIGVAILSAG